MASTASSLLKLEKMADGEQDSTWGQKTNTNLELLEQGLAGMTEVTVTTADVTLTDTQFVANEARKMILKASGALTGDRAIIVPARTKLYVVHNTCTGAHDLTVKTSAGTGVVIPASGKSIVYCDGTNVVKVVDTGALTDIVSDTTPQLGGALDTNGAAINESEGSAVASATSTNIWSATGNTVHVTGTTTITGFGTAPRVGAWRKVIFDGALTLTHSANLNLPGSDDITTAAGDIAFVYADTTTQLDVLFFPKSGKAVVGAAATLTTQGDILYRNSSGLARLAKGTAGQALRMNSGATAPEWADLTDVGTGDSLSGQGTAYNSGSIPAGTKQVRIGLVGTSLNASGDLLLQLGDSGGIEATGYSSHVVVIASAIGGENNPTTGFGLTTTGFPAGATFSGVITLTLINDSTNTWAIGGSLMRTDSAATAIFSGVKSLSGALTQVTLTSIAGTASLDGGTFTRIDVL